EDREALVLRFLEEKSLREVGERLGLGEDAAQKRVSRALDALGHLFRRRGYAVPAVTAALTALYASTEAAPAGFAAVVTHSALAAGGAASTAGLALLVSKFMALTKFQVAAGCVVLAAIPVTYEWHAAATSRTEQQSLASQVAGLRQQVAG